MIRADNPGEGKKIKIRAGVYSNPGNIRDKNEDNFFFYESYLTEAQNKQWVSKYGESGTPAMFAICDGMGGRENGDIASRMGIYQLIECSSSIKKRKDPVWIKTNLEKVMEEGNLAITRESGKLGKMGTTIALLYFSEDHIWAVNVGDSRIYLLSGEELLQISVDHNLEGELLASGMMNPEVKRHQRASHELTQYLGIPSQELKIEPFFKKLDYKEDRTIFLICSDGITEGLESKAIQEILINGKNPEQVAIQLGESALENKSMDNVTAIVIEIMKDEMDNG